MVDVCRPSVIRAVANREVMENSAEYIKSLLEIPGENLISVLDQDRSPESLLIGQLLRILSLFPFSRPDDRIELPVLLEKYLIANLIAEISDTVPHNIIVALRGQDELIDSLDAASRLLENGTDHQSSHSGNDKRHLRVTELFPKVLRNAVAPLNQDPAAEVTAVDILLRMLKRSLLNITGNRLRTFSL